MSTDFYHSSLYYSSRTTNTNPATANHLPYYYESLLNICTIDQFTQLTDVIQHFYQHCVLPYNTHHYLEESNFTFQKLSYSTVYETSHTIPPPRLLPILQYFVEVIGFDPNLSHDGLEPIELLLTTGTPLSPSSHIPVHLIYNPNDISMPNPTMSPQETSRPCNPSHYQHDMRINQSNYVPDYVFNGNINLISYQDQHDFFHHSTSPQNQRNLDVNKLSESCYFFIDLPHCIEYLLGFKIPTPTHLTTPLPESIYNQNSSYYDDEYQLIIEHGFPNHQSQIDPLGFILTYHGFIPYKHALTTYFIAPYIHLNDISTVRRALLLIINDQTVQLTGPGSSQTRDPREEHNQHRNDDFIIIKFLYNTLFGMVLTQYNCKDPFYINNSLTYAEKYKSLHIPLLYDLNTNPPKYDLTEPFYISSIIKFYLSLLITLTQVALSSPTFPHFHDLCPPNITFTSLNSRYKICKAPKPTATFRPIAAPDSDDTVTSFAAAVHTPALPNKLATTSSPINYNLSNTVVTSNGSVVRTKAAPTPESERSTRVDLNSVAYSTKITSLKFIFQHFLTHVFPRFHDAPREQDTILNFYTTLSDLLVLIDAADPTVIRLGDKFALIKVFWFANLPLYSTTPIASNSPTYYSHFPPNHNNQPYLELLNQNILPHYHTPSHPYIATLPQLSVVEKLIAIINNINTQPNMSNNSNIHNYKDYALQQHEILSFCALLEAYITHTVQGAQILMKTHNYPADPSYIIQIVLLHIKNVLVQSNLYFFPSITCDATNSHPFQTSIVPPNSTSSNNKLNVLHVHDNCEIVMYYVLLTTIRTIHTLLGLMAGDNTALRLVYIHDHDLFEINNRTHINLVKTAQDFFHNFHTNSSPNLLARRDRLQDVTPPVNEFNLLELHKPSLLWYICLLNIFAHFTRVKVTYKFVQLLLTTSSTILPMEIKGIIYRHIEYDLMFSRSIELKICEQCCVDPRVEVVSRLPQTFNKVSHSKRASGDNDESDVDYLTPPSLSDDSSGGAFPLPIPEPSSAPHITLSTLNSPPIPPQNPLKKEKHLDGDDDDDDDDHYYSYFGRHDRFIPPQPSPTRGAAPLRTFDDPIPQKSIHYTKDIQVYQVKDTDYLLQWLFEVDQFNYFNLLNNNNYHNVPFYLTSFHNINGAIVSHPATTAAVSSSARSAHATLNIQTPTSSTHFSLTPGELEAQHQAVLNDPLNPFTNINIVYTNIHNNTNDFKDRKQWMISHFINSKHITTDGVIDAPPSDHKGTSPLGYSSFISPFYLPAKDHLLFTKLLLDTATPLPFDYTTMRINQYINLDLPHSVNRRFPLFPAKLKVRLEPPSQELNGQYTKEQKAWIIENVKFALSRTDSSFPLPTEKQRNQFFPPHIIAELFKGLTTESKISNIVTIPPTLTSPLIKTTINITYNSKHHIYLPIHNVLRTKTANSALKHALLQHFLTLGYIYSIDLSKYILNNTNFHWYYLQKRLSCQCLDLYRNIKCKNYIRYTSVVDGNQSEHDDPKKKSTFVTAFDLQQANKSSNIPLSTPTQQIGINFNQTNPTNVIISSLLSYQQENGINDPSHRVTGNNGDIEDDNDNEIVPPNAPTLSRTSSTSLSTSNNTSIPSSKSSRIRSHAVIDDNYYFTNYNPYSILLHYLTPLQCALLQTDEEFKTDGGYNLRIFWLLLNNFHSDINIPLHPLLLPYKYQIIPDQKTFVDEWNNPENINANVIQFQTPSIPLYHQISFLQTLIASSTTSLVPQDQIKSPYHNDNHTIIVIPPQKIRLPNSSTFSTNALISTPLLTFFTSSSAGQYVIATDLLFYLFAQPNNCSTITTAPMYGLQRFKPSPNTFALSPHGVHSNDIFSTNVLCFRDVHQFTPFGRYIAYMTQCYGVQPNLSTALTASTLSFLQLSSNASVITTQQNKNLGKCNDDVSLFNYSYNDYYSIMGKYSTSRSAVQSVPIRQIHANIHGPIISRFLSLYKSLSLSMEDNSHLFGSPHLIYQSNDPRLMTFPYHHVAKGITLSQTTMIHKKNILALYPLNALLHAYPVQFPELVDTITTMLASWYQLPSNHDRFSLIAHSQAMAHKYPGQEVSISTRRDPFTIVPLLFPDIQGGLKRDKSKTIVPIPLPLFTPQSYDILNNLDHGQYTLHYACDIGREMYHKQLIYEILQYSSINTITAVTQKEFITLQCPNTKSKDKSSSSSASSSSLLRRVKKRIKLTVVLQIMLNDSLIHVYDHKKENILPNVYKQVVSSALSEYTARLAQLNVNVPQQNSDGFSNLIHSIPSQSNKTHSMGPNTSESRNSLDSTILTSSQSDLPSFQLSYTQLELSQPTHPKDNPFTDDFPDLPMLPLSESNFLPMLPSSLSLSPSEELGTFINDIPMATHNNTSIPPQSDQIYFPYLPPKTGFDEDNDVVEKSYSSSLSDFIQTNFLSSSTLQPQPITAWLSTPTATLPNLPPILSDKLGGSVHPHNLNNTHNNPQDTSFVPKQPKVQVLYHKKEISESFNPPSSFFKMNSDLHYENISRNTIESSTFHYNDEHDDYNNEDGNKIVCSDDDGCFLSPKAHPAISITAMSTTSNTSIYQSLYTYVHQFHDNNNLDDIDLDDDHVFLSQPATFVPTSFKHNNESLDGIITHNDDILKEIDINNNNEPSRMSIISYNYLKIPTFEQRADLIEMVLETLVEKLLAEQQLEFILTYWTHIINDPDLNTEGKYSCI